MRLPIIVSTDVLRSVCLALLVLPMTSAEAGKTQSVPTRANAGEIATGGHLSVGHSIRDLLDHPAFAGHARLILPGDDRGYDEDMSLSNIGSLLPYHSHVR